MRFTFIGCHFVCPDFVKTLIVVIWAVSFLKLIPFAFTETGAMLSSILSSSRAISVNIAVMRTFVRLRSFLTMDSSVPERLSSLEQGTNKLFRIVFERLDQVDEVLKPRLHPNRKRIGLKDE